MCTNFDSESAAAAECFSLFLTTISIAMLMPRPDASPASYSSRRGPKIARPDGGGERVRGLDLGLQGDPTGFDTGKGMDYYATCLGQLSLFVFQKKEKIQVGRPFECQIQLDHPLV